LCCSSASGIASNDEHITEVGEDTMLRVFTKKDAMDLNFAEKKNREVSEHYSP
jgi:hypothetical protein